MHKRPIWFVFSGMGSQWTGMGTKLMEIPIFANAIHKCHEILKPLGINLIDVITTSDPKIFDNILNSFVGIAAVQVSKLHIFVCINNHNFLLLFGSETDYLLFKYSTIYFMLTILQESFYLPLISTKIVVKHFTLSY